MDSGQRPVGEFRRRVEVSGANQHVEVRRVSQINAALAESQRPCTSSLQAILEREKLDAIVAPTGNPAWPIDLVNGDHFLGGSSTPAAVAGFPHVTVPAGYVSGLPVGVSFIGAPWSEGTLVRLAYAYEQATMLRRPPRFLPTMSVSTGG